MIQQPNRIDLAFFRQICASAFFFSLCLCVCTYSTDSTICVHTCSLSPPTHTHAHGKVEKKEVEGPHPFRPYEFCTQTSRRSRMDGRTNGFFIGYFQTDSSVLFFKYYINTCHFYRYLSQTRWGVVIVVDAVVALKNPTRKNEEIVQNFYYSLSMSLFDSDRWIGEDQRGRSGRYYEKGGRRGLP